MGDVFAGNMWVYKSLLYKYTLSQVFTFLLSISNSSIFKRLKLEYSYCF